MYYLYILKNRRGNFYVGQTNNLHRRLKDHKSSGGAKFIKDYGEFKLVYSEVFDTRIEAMRRKSQLKGWTNTKEQALIDGSLKLLKILSQNKQN